MEQTKSNSTGQRFLPKWAFFAPGEARNSRLKNTSAENTTGAYREIFSDQGHAVDPASCRCGESRLLLEAFVQAVSHELKTPVTSLRLVSQMQKRKLLAGDPSVFDEKSMIRWIELIDRQTARLNRIIEGFSQDLDRLENGVTGRAADEPKSARACCDANE